MPQDASKGRGIGPPERGCRQTRNGTGAEMKIERKFTSAGKDAYAGIQFGTTISEIRNPDGKIVFRNEAVEVPEGWSQVASDVLAQKYFRKAGVPARLKRVKEKGVPEFLWRSVPDDRGAGKAARSKSGWSARPRRGRSSTGWPAPGPIGAGRAAISPPKPMPAPISTRCASCWPADGGAELAAMVQHRAALGLRHRRPGAGALLRRSQDRRTDQIRPAPMSIRSRMPASSSRSATIW
jgi:hypothetical protein